MENDTDDRTAALDRREAALRARILQHELSQALHGARCLPEALSDAVAIMAGQCAVEFNDTDGSIAKLTLGEKSFVTASEAAAAFLENRGHFVAQEAPGNQEPAKRVDLKVVRSETRNETRTTPPKKPEAKGESLDDLIAKGYSASDIAALGWKTPPAE